MIKAILQTPGLSGWMIIGLTEANVDKLRLDMPVDIDLEELREQAGGAEVHRIVIMLEKDEAAVLAKLRVVLPGAIESAEERGVFIDTTKEGEDAAR